MTLTLDRPVAPQAPPGRRWSERRRATMAGYAFLAPWLVGFFGITALPMLGSLVLSFTNFSGSFRNVEWIGLENYRIMFTVDPAYWGSVRVTFLYVFLSVPVMLAFALAVAAMLNKGLRALGLYRTIFYVPSLLGGSVAVAVLWRFVWGESGLVNDVLGVLGLESGSWIGNPDTALVTIMVLNVWTFGSPMIIFLAGLRQVPPELYEAASLDGAGRWQRFRHITMPSISPVVLFNGILALIGGFQAFTQVYVVSGGTGGPAGSTLFYTLLLYQRAFTELRFGYASAMAWVLLVVIAAATALVFASGRFWVHYGDES
jgi:pectin-derived oligosaccharide transport system permease protein